MTFGLETSLVELKSRRALMEIQQLGLRRRVGDFDREYARLEAARRRGDADAQALQDLRERRLEAATEMEQLEGTICELDDQIARTEQGDVVSSVDHVIVQSLQASGELDRLRTFILDTVRSLAEPLQQYEQLAERQRSLTGRIRQATGKDNSYAAYIDTALLRASDYDDQLQLVIETLRRARVVQ